MPNLIITEIHGLNGTYEADFDIGSLTNRELRLIKRISGVTAGKLGDALKDGDNDLLVAYAVVFLVRAGKDPDMAEALLWDAPVGAVEFDMDEAEQIAEAEAEADARPPDSPTPNGNVNDPGDVEKLNVSFASFGQTSPSGSAPQGSDPSPTGSPPSDTGAASTPVTSAT